MRDIVEKKQEYLGRDEVEVRQGKLSISHFEEDFSPEFINTKVVPLINQLIDENPSRLKGYHLWPKYRLNQPVQQGRYPRRLLDYKWKPGDTPILLGPTEIGMMLCLIPYMAEMITKGVGIPMHHEAGRDFWNQINLKRERKLSGAPPKRKTREQLNATDYTTDPAMKKEVYRRLPFLSNRKEGQDKWQEVSIKENTKHYVIKIDMPAGSKIKSVIPTTSNVTLQNYTKVKNAVYLRQYDSERKEKKEFIDR